MKEELYPAAHGLIRGDTITAGWVGHDISGQWSLLPLSQFRGECVGAQANYPKFTKLSVFFKSSLSPSILEKCM